MADEKIEIEIVLDDGQIKKGFANVKRKARDTARDTEGSFKKAFSGIGRQIGAIAVGFASLRSIQKVTGDFIAFERALAGVAKTTNIGGRDLDKLGVRLQNISTEIPVTANELLRLAQVAGQFGVRGTDNIIKFTETVGKLQFAIEGIDAETAAQSLTRILNVTGQGVKNIDRLSSALVELGNNFEATEGDILATGNEVIRATAQFGVSAEQGLALGAALQSVGAKAEGSGTAVGKAFRQIAKAISTGGKELRNFEKILGISGDELRKQFDEDAIGVFERLIKGLGGVTGGSVGLTKALKQLGLDQDRVIKSLVPLVQAQEKLNSALRSGEGAYQKNTALNQEFGRVNETTEAAVKRLQNRITQLSTTIGTILGPTIRDNINLFDQFAKSINSGLTRVFGSGPAKQIATIEFNLNKVNSELIRVQNNINAARDRLAESPDDEKLLLSLDRQKEDLAILRERFIELKAERDAFFLENPDLAPPPPPAPTPTEDEDKKAPILEQFKPGDLVPEFTSAFTTIDETVEESVSKFGERSEQLKKSFREIGVAARKQLAGGIGGAFAAAGRAIAGGENAIEAFAKAFIGAIGEMAIQSGTRFILEGLAYSVVPGFQGVGAAMIASGAALALFGGAISALAGGGGGEAQASTPLAPTDVAFAADDDIGEDEEFDVRDTKVAINVEGTVLDPVSVGNQIAEILNDTFDAGGTKVVTA